MDENIRYMVFIDGSNFLIELSKDLDLKFRADKPPNSAISICNSYLSHMMSHSSKQIIRRYWFSSFKGGDDYKSELARFLRDNNFEPVLFKRKNSREKGVDIGLTKEMLVNAFNQNSDIGILVAGDEDYLELVHETKRYGPRIWGVFFEHGLASELRVAFDKFYPIDLKNRIPNLDEFIEKIKIELRKT